MQTKVYLQAPVSLEAVTILERKQLSVMLPKPRTEWCQHYWNCEDLDDTSRTFAVTQCILSPWVWHSLSQNYHQQALQYVSLAKPKTCTFNTSYVSLVKLSKNNTGMHYFILTPYYHLLDRLCGLVVRVSGYRYRGLGFDSRRYQIFWVVVGLERGPLSLVRSTEELLE